MNGSLLNNIERELTDTELINLLCIAQAALHDPATRAEVLAALGLREDEGLALLHNVTEVVGPFE